MADGMTRSAVLRASCTGHSDVMRAHDLPLPSDADAVNSREGLVAYVTRLQVAIEGGVEVENGTLDRFLEALAAKIDAQPASGGGPSWSYFSHMLSAALIYE